MADVLVVEDDFLTRNNLTELLQRSGYKVFSAESGEEALKLLQKLNPEIIISDIMMPGIDGYELLRRVNAEENENHIPFIFLTARTELSDFRQGMLAGVDDFITKPFKAQDLLKSVETRLKKKEKSERKIVQFKNCVACNISHEFRTPLIPIIGYSQLLTDNYLHLEADEVREISLKINSAGNWMLRLVEKFLLLVELDEADSIVENSYCNTTEVIHACARRVASSNARLEDLFISLKPAAAVSLPQQDLERIVTELLENAFRFSKNGSPIEISSHSTQDYFILTIRDSGIGMSHLQLKTVSSFLQFNRQGMHKAGLGLGLAIVKKLAEKYGLSINIESQPGEFTQVSLRLPLIL
ncbi:MAG: hybrid sensor histidine kinase/response regulator [Ignavibacteria bacterium]|nr:hybrid sensor histidine kinase/response regulator [Ignavibacteria bacterium]MCU7504911.1 hybrid sensor histidine kinase/response regulator [Ignavibacteria bacterium]MCU7517797.1 hybrid sensor histidine kinase/response regulator [Ignavibacteria bacterium]